MYLGIDIGGTKTLVASLDDRGVITEQAKFPTPKDYDDFLVELTNTVDGLTTKEWHATGVAAPGRIDRTHGRVVAFGNLPWRDVPLQADVEKIVHCPVGIENDANLAGLSEAMLHKHINVVLYLTVSTGINDGVIRGQKIDPSFQDSEPGHMILSHHGKLKTWEDFASGRAIVEQFGKRAVDITDEKTWKTIARNLSAGLIELLAIVQPEIIIIGGSVGTHFDHYGHYLEEYLKHYETPLVPVPPIIRAQRPEEAVVYGCYDYVKGLYGTTN